MGVLAWLPRALTAPAARALLVRAALRPRPAHRREFSKVTDSQATEMYFEEIFEQVGLVGALGTCLSRGSPAETRSSTCATTSTPAARTP